MEITPYDVRRIYSFYDEIKQIERGETPIPRMALFYPTYVCDMRCIYCDYEEENKEYHCHMPKEKMEHAVNCLIDLGVEAFELCGGGDPLIYPHINELVERLFSKNIKLGILTNGSKFKDDLMKKIVEKGSYIRISIDTVREEVYNRIRRPIDKNAFKVVTENIEKACKYRDEIGSGIQIGLKVLLTSFNYYSNLINEVFHFAKEHNIDSVQFKVARTGTCFMSDKELERKEEEIRGFGHMHGVKTLVGLQKSSINFKCFASPLHVMVDTFGDLYPCCYFQHRKESHKFGNLFEEPLKRIWGGKKHREVLQDIKIEECNVQDCRFHRYNEILKEAIFEDKAQLQFL